MNYKIPDFPDLSYGTVYCIGRNYSEHIEEMKSSRTKDPVVFLKPRSSIIHSGEKVVIPKQSSDVHHEVELVLLIGKTTENVSPDNALNCIEAFGVGIDFTARDLQNDAKKNGKPWSLCKGFRTFAPVGNLIGYDGNTDIDRLQLTLTVNGENRQNDNTDLMIFNSAEIISYLSHQFILTPGDLIFTGTPKGVSSVTRGDIITGKIGDGLSTIDVDVQ
ncbi:FAA hydrolase family protein [Rhodohalobacter sp. SW132]|uniref:fumarylacetoacetate hydrolase family protein n=1 Tax=Rhodohalobacter sp. SW132 TaxID=2293433 RepID=UPI000E247981|nr:fumarylacetoacetate hydrolase family protein [Rhodohalobacter sp. SW132]REL33271.1 FAA hydrolase family protein [Rhodohalobacter sp. SW132]